jgi:hypothetical protein
MDCRDPVLGCDLLSDIGYLRVLLDLLVHWHTFLQEAGALRQMPW